MERFQFEGTSKECITKLVELGAKKEDATDFIRKINEIKKYLSDDEFIDKIEEAGESFFPLPPKYRINVKVTDMEIKLGFFTLKIGIERKVIFREDEGEVCVKGEIYKISRTFVNLSLFDRVTGSECLHKQRTTCRYSVNHKCTLDKTNLTNILESLVTKGCLVKEFEKYYTN